MFPRRCAIVRFVVFVCVGVCLRGCLVFCCIDVFFFFSPFRQSRPSPLSLSVSLSLSLSSEKPLLHVCGVLLSLCYFSLLFLLLSFLVLLVCLRLHRRRLEVVAVETVAEVEAVETVAEVAASIARGQVIAGGEMIVAEAVEAAEAAAVTGEPATEEAVVVAGATIVAEAEAEAEEAAGVEAEEEAAGVEEAEVVVASARSRVRSRRSPRRTRPQSISSPTTTFRWR
jgi:hypothetical protein